MKKLALILMMLTCLAAATLLTCEKVPDYCGKGEWYNPDYQFCFNRKAYPLCGNGSYNPLTEGCDENNAVGTRCAGGGFVPPGTPCAGYTLSTATAPADGGKIIRVPDKASYAAGEQVALSATDPKEGYEFIGWAGAKTSSSAELTVTMDNNTPLIAMFNPKSAPGAATHTLTTTAFPENGGAITRNQPGPDYAKGTQVTVTAAPNPGYTFSGWSGVSASKLSAVTITMDGGKTLVAMFAPIAYTLTINANPAAGGTVYIDGTAQTGAAPQNAGTTVEAYAQPAEGYVFTEWSGAAAGTDNPVMITMTDGDRTLTANFRQGDGPTTPTTYTLTVNVAPTGSGTVTRDPDKTNYNNGEQVTVTAAAAQGYTFSGWSGASTSTNASVVVTMDGNKTLTANFQQQQAITYTLSTGVLPTGSGTVTRNPDKTNYNSGEQVTVTAAAAQGYSFAGWSGASTSTSSPVTITMDGNKVLTANFQSTMGGGEGVMAGDTLVYRGQTYYTVVISGKRWMAKNLNHATANSLCYDNQESYCATYGRLYTWEAAVSACEAIGGEWHLPSDAEWHALVSHANPSCSGRPDDIYCDGAGTKLRSNGGWNDYYGKSGNGTDDVGFSALPGGYYLGGSGPFSLAGCDGFWWSATEFDARSARSRQMSCTGEGVERNAYNKLSQFAVRCLRDGGTTYTLTVNASPAAGGSVTRNPDKANYNSGEQVTVTAAAAQGYEFTGWSGADNSTTSPILLVMDGHKTLTANFQETTTDPCVLNPSSAECCAFNLSYPGCGGGGGVVYGDTLIDPRDGQKYVTVIIDGKRWMAENLNYAATGSKCGGTYGLLKDENTMNCDKYGRLYTWEAAVSACPAGWHLPSDAEWHALVSHANPSCSGSSNDSCDVAGTKLKSANGWDDYLGVPSRDTDNYGFSALPGGFGYGGSFYSVGIYGSWWSATETEDGTDYAWRRNMFYGNGYVYRVIDFKTRLLSARCLQE